MEYYERIRALREDKDLNQTELAKAIHSTQKTISNWEKGYSEPNIEMIKELCKFFDVSADYILGLSNNQTHHWNTKNQVNINGGQNYGNININQS